MLKAKFVQRGDSIDFTPGGDVESGEIVRLGNLIGIAKISVKANELGSLALSGVFDLAKPPGIAFAAGTGVYWNAGNISASGGVLLGMAVAHASSESESVRILLNYSGNDAVTGDPGDWQTL